MLIPEQYSKSSGYDLYIDTVKGDLPAVIFRHRYVVLETDNKGKQVPVTLAFHTLKGAIAFINYAKHHPFVTSPFPSNEELSGINSIHNFILWQEQQPDWKNCYIDPPPLQKISI